ALRTRTAFKPCPKAASMSSLLPKRLYTTWKSSGSPARSLSLVGEVHERLASTPVAPCAAGRHDSLIWSGIRRSSWMSPGVISAGDDELPEALVPSPGEVLALRWSRTETPTTSAT